MKITRQTFNNLLYLCVAIKKAIMAEITLKVKYDARNARAKKKLLDFLSSDLFKIEKPSPKLEKALEEVKDGKVTHFSTIEDFEEWLKEV